MALGLLGTHVEESPDRPHRLVVLHAGPGLLRSLLLVCFFEESAGGGEAEVSDFDVFLFIEEDVRGFDVAMNHAVLVDVGEAFEQLSDQLDEHGAVGPQLSVVDELSEGEQLAALHLDEQVLHLGVFFLGLAGLESLEVVFGGVLHFALCVEVVVRVQEYQLEAALFFGARLLFLALLAERGGV